MKARIAFQSPEQNVRWPQNFSLRARIRADKQNFIIRGNSHGFCFARRFFSWAGHALGFGPSQIDEGQSPPQMKETKIAFLILCANRKAPKTRASVFAFGFASQTNQKMKDFENQVSVLLCKSTHQTWIFAFLSCSCFSATFLNFGHQAALQFEQLVDAKYRNPSHSEISVFFSKRRI